MTEFDNQNQAPDPSLAGQPASSAAPVMAGMQPLAGPQPSGGGVGGILQGTGLETMVAGWLKHAADIQNNSLVGKQVAAANAEKAAAAARPVVNRPPPDATAAAASSVEGGAKPGSFSDKLGDALSDASHATDKKGGWLQGIENTAAARKQRMEQKTKDDILLARSQAENVAMHRNFYNQDQKDRQEFHEGNQKFLAKYDQSNEQEAGVSADELAKRMQADPDFAKKYMVRATGDVPVVGPDGEMRMEKDSKRPQMKPTYTVMTIASKDGSDVTGTVDAARSAELNKYLGLNYPPGTKLTMAQDNKIDQELQISRGTATIIGNTNGKPLSQETIDATRHLLADYTVAHAIALVPGNAYAGIVQSKKIAEDHRDVFNQQLAAATAKKDQAGVDAANAGIKSVNEEEAKLDAITSAAILPKQKEDFQKKMGISEDSVAEYVNDPSKIQGHTESVMAAADDTIANSKDPAVIATAKRAKIMAQNVQKAEDQRKIDLAVDEQSAKTKAAKIDNNPNGLSGDAYLKTLPVGRANLVNAISQGRLPVNASAFERSTAGKSNQLADDVFAAYPDFNATLGEKWPKAIDQFTISGTDHKKVQAYNVALQHMKNLYDTTTAEGIINPLSKDYQDRALTMTQVTREFGNAVAQGVLTQSEAEDISKALTGGLTPELKRERVRAAAGLLNAKIHEVQREFDALAPSASIKVPTLLAPEGKLVVDYLTSKGGQTPPNAQTSQAAKPNIHANQPANTVYMQKPNGDYMYIPKDKQKAAEAAGAKVVTP